MRMEMNLLSSSDQSLFFWRFTPCIFLVRLCEKDTAIHWRFARLPVKSHSRARIDMLSRTGARAGSATDCATAELPKKDEVGAKALTLAESVLKATMAIERRRTIVGSLKYQR